MFMDYQRVNMSYTKLVNGIRVELTREETEARQAEEQAEQERQALYEQTEKYRDERRTEYPAIGDQLDAIHKQLKTLIGDDGVPIDPEYQNIKDQIDAIKVKYPKPAKKAGNK